MLCALIVGCAAKNTTVVNTPAGVTSSQVNAWTSAVTDLSQAQALTHGGLGAVVALNHATPPVFPDGAAYAATLQGFGRAEQIEIQAATFLKTVPNSWSASTSAKISAYMTQILAQLAIANQNGTLGIRSPASVTTVTNIIGQTVTLINLVQSIAKQFSTRLLITPRQPAWAQREASIVYAT